MRKSLAIATSLALVLVAFTLGDRASAQVAAPTIVSVEGPTSDITVSGNVATLTVMGMSIEVRSTDDISTPTTTFARSGLSLQNFLLGSQLPGRVQSGFLGGTAIVEGVYNTARGVVEAETVFVEPAENVILGEFTASSCTNADCSGPNDFIRVNGQTPAKASTDPRMAFRKPTSGLGFALNLAGADLTGVGAALEGYYGNTPVSVGAGSELAYYWFAFELFEDVPTLLANKTVSEVSTFRASCSVGGRLEVRGGTHVPVTAAGAAIGNPAAGSIQIFALNPTTNAVGALRGTTTPVRVDATSPFAEYRFRQNTNNCPAAVQVRWVVGGTTVRTTFPVEII